MDCRNGDPMHEGRMSVSHTGYLSHGNSKNKSSGKSGKKERGHEKGKVPNNA